MSIPTLPANYYGQHPVLSHVHRAARHRRTSPDVVLGALLCRVATLIPVTGTVHRSQVNYLTAIVGPSGSGKTTANRCARDLLPEIGTPLDGVPPGSGEGIVQRYLARQKIDGESVQVQTNTAALFHTDEGEQLLNLADRQGSTTLATIRTMWAGDTVGNSNANSETSRVLPHDQYRFTMTLGLQPGFASQLLANSSAGDPQRFLWVGTGDPDAPEVIPTWPGPLPMPNVIGAPFEIADDIRREIDRTQLATLRAGGHSDPLEAHAGLLRLRTAAIFATLLGTPGTIDADPWLLALELVEHSAKVTTYLGTLSAEHQRERDAELIDRQEAREEIRAQKAAPRIARRLAEKVQHEDWLRPDLYRSCNSRDRPYFDDALAFAFRHGWITQRGSDLTRGAVSDVR